MSEIVLATLNARYAHTSFGLRYLYANLGPLQDRASIAEYTISQQPIDIAEQLLAMQPSILGLGVYIWNARLTAELVSLLKRVKPELIIVLGGPEVSYEWQEQDIVTQADYLITGEGDLAFAELCNELLNDNPPDNKVIAGSTPPMHELSLPYRYYSDTDLAQRVLYVEASRGCPFRCEFCLSSLDKAVRNVDPDLFLAEMDKLIERGAKSFKFVDRTFNLDIKTSSRILEFFLERLQPDLFLHFEMIPDRLPESLKKTIARFPEGVLQFEIGIQSFDIAVNKRIERRQKNEVAEENLRFLAHNTGVHMHSDLIVGLPGESIDMFAKGFDRLLALGPQEIQVGILKRLRGTSLQRHDQEWGMVYSNEPPYEVLQTSNIGFADMQRMKRFARFWDQIANSGNFVRTAPLIWAESPAFLSFFALCDWLFARHGRAFSISLDRMAESLFTYLCDEKGLTNEEVGKKLWADYSMGGRRRRIPGFLQPYRIKEPKRPAPDQGSGTAARQSRHRQGRSESGAQKSPSHQASS